MPIVVRRRWFTVLSAMAVLIAFLGGRALAETEKPLKIVATTSMIADAARQIGGELVDVKALMGPGVDPHAYRQTRTDILAMTNADLVLWHGLYLEAQMEEFMLKLGKRQNVVAVAEALPKTLLRAHDNYENKFDPHVWMAPQLWSKVAIAVRDAMIEAKPDARAAFEANAERFSGEITKLDDYAGRILSSVPAETRVLVTAHDAFSYFGAAYGFEVIGIQGISTESEAGLKRISDLVDVLVSRKIGAVFVESSVSDRNMRALIEGAAAKGHKVTVGGELFSDAMGMPGTYEGTYIGMIDHNATVISSALGGDAPERGMSGHLASAS